MTKRIFAFFLLSYLVTVNTYGHGGLINPVEIERSPSATNMLDFSEGIIQQITLAEHQHPGKALTLDFNHKLLNLFGRLEKDTNTRETWKNHLKELAQKIVKNHNVQGIRIVYSNIDDLQIVGCILEPFVTTNKLETCWLIPHSNE